MNGTHLLALIVLLALIIMLLGWGSQNDRERALNDPSGTYIAFLPRIPSGEQTVVAHLDRGGARSAYLTVDPQTGASPVVEQGVWRRGEDGDVRMIVGASTTYVFAVEPDALRLRDPDPDRWGVSGLSLARAALPLETEWRWMRTEYAAGLVARPATGTPFIVGFDPDLRLSITGDCNDVSGGFGLRRDGALVVGDLISTKKSCAASQEASFLGDFARADAYAVRDGVLTLVLPEGRGRMTFTRYSGDAPNE